MARTAITTQRLRTRFMGGSTLFNGTTSTIPTTLTDNSVFKTGNGFTLFAWIKPKSGGEGTGGRIFDKSQADSALDGIKWQLLSGGNINLRIAGTSITSGTNYFKKNRWQFLLVTVSNDSLVSHYIDNVLSGTPGTAGALSNITVSNPLTIGNRSGATDFTFDGLIGECGIIPRVVTEAERYAIMNGSFPSDTTNLWKLDDQPSTYVDSIGGENGTGANTTYSQDFPVQQRSLADDEAKASLLFDGVDDYLETTYSSILTFGTNSFSFTFVYKMTGLVASNRDILVKNRNTGENLLLIRSRVNGTELLFQFYSDASNKVDLTVSNFWLLNIWAKYTFIVNRETGYAEAYRNGLLLGRLAITGNPIDTTTKGFVIGKGIFSGGYSKGLAKRLFVNAKALSLTEIKNFHFNNIIPTESLVLNLKMNEGAGTIAYDTSGNGNHGTITGAVWSSDVPSKKRKAIGGNLVNNGDFAYQPPFVANQTTSGRWLDGTAAGSTSKLPINVYVSFGGAAGDKYARLTERNGIKCLLVHINAGAFAEIRNGSTVYYGVRSSQDFDVKPNTQYKLSGYIEAENVSGDSDSGVYVTVLFSKSDGTSSEAKSSPNIKVNSPRTYFETIFTTNSTSRCGHIECRVYGHTGAATLAGDFYFSDIQLVEVGAARLPVT